MAKKLTKEEFIRRAREIHGDKYDYSEVPDFKTTKEKVKIWCNTCKKFFFQQVDRHLRGAGCWDCGHELVISKKRLNKDEFLKKAKEIHGDKFDYSEVHNFKSPNEPVKIKCNICGSIFEISPKAHLRSTKHGGCKNCRYLSLREKFSDTFEEFKEKAREVHRDKYDYCEEGYVNRSTKITITCRNCGCVFQQDPSSHLAGHGCPKCAHKEAVIKQSLTIEKFIEKSNFIHGVGKYDYSKVIYVNNSTPVTIICNTCHKEFSQVAGSHMAGHGCPYCAYETSRKEQSLSRDEFIKRSEEIWGKGTYDYSEVVYVNNRTVVQIHCNICGIDFKQSPENHMRGCIGCNCREDIYTLDQVISMIKDKFGDRFEIVPETFINYCKAATFIDHQKGDSTQIISPLVLLLRKNVNESERYYGEELVSKWLINNNIKYERQHPVSEIIRNRLPVKIDFQIIYNRKIIWIEYHGDQHYRYIEFFHNHSMEDFKNQLDRDKRIREYCKVNQIPLYEIPYSLYHTEETIFEFLDKTILQGVDPHSFIDYDSLYELPEE